MDDDLPPLWLPEIVIRALRAGADHALNTSGGVDSLALVRMMARWHRAQQFPGQLYMIWANLVRAEWPQTEAFIAQSAEELALPLIVVQREKGDLLDRFDERRATLDAQGRQDTPHFPTNHSLYCNSELKRVPLDKHFRLSPLHLSSEGIRANESANRAEKEPFTVRMSITGKRYKCLPPAEAWQLYAQDIAERAQRPVQQPLFEGESSTPERPLPRLGYTLYPLFYWQKSDAFRACGTTVEELEERRHLYRLGVDYQDAGMRARALEGWNCHPGYVMGARRISCSICFQSDEMTIRAGAYASPSYYRALCWREIQSGFSFQMDRWLSSIVPELLTDEQRAALEVLPPYLIWQEKRRLRSRRSLPVLKVA